ncbi:prophage P1 protein 61 [Fructobacillus fructosus]|nr:prophage P1 protein 61 [Fructobacillus fructosus]
MTNNSNDNYLVKAICKNCGQPYKYTVHDWSESDTDNVRLIFCPWCNVPDGEVHGSDMISIFVTKLNDQQNPS